MITHDMAQGEVEWFKIRIGKVTASEAGNILTPEFKERVGEMPKSYLYKKLAEKWQGHALPGFTSFSTEQGNIKEDIAIPWFRFEYDNYKVHLAGFVETEDGFSGCSPDALIGDDGGLEVKCPESNNHVRYLIEGKLPADYAVQVHFSMYVTGRPWWIFLSYRKGFPAFILKVLRDEGICGKIDAAVKAFRVKLDAGFEAMTKAKLTAEGLI